MNTSSDTQHQSTTPDPGVTTPPTDEPNDGPGVDGHHVITGECFSCMVGVSTGPESHGDRCPVFLTEAQK